VRAVLKLKDELEWGSRVKKAVVEVDGTSLGDIDDLLEDVLEEVLEDVLGVDPDDEDCLYEVLGVEELVSFELDFVDCCREAEAAFKLDRVPHLPYPI
jgi:hypothetical protein